MRFLTVKTRRNVFLLVFIACGMLYLGLCAAVVEHAYEFIRQPRLSVFNPTVLVLGNRARVKGIPNVCLTGRVDAGLEVLAENQGKILLVTGGLDPVEQRFESQVMAEHARAMGFAGEVIQEQRATTTYENFKYSTLLLQSIGAKTVVVASEPHHLWRARLLAQAQGMDKQFDLRFVAAKTECGKLQGLSVLGVLVEPLALIKNFLQGHF